MSEVGRELKASELIPRTVVVLHSEAKAYVTAWYLQALSPTLATFYMEEIGTTLILTIRADGTLVDDSGEQIHVYQYLGKI